MIGAEVTLSNLKVLLHKLCVGSGIHLDVQ